MTPAPGWDLSSALEQEEPRFCERCGRELEPEEHGLCWSCDAIEREELAAEAWDDDDDGPPFDEEESWDGFGYWDPKPEDDVDYGPDAEFLDRWCSKCRGHTAHVITERGENAAGPWAKARCTDCFLESQHAVAPAPPVPSIDNSPWEFDDDLPF